MVLFSRIQVHFGIYPLFINPFVLLYLFQLLRLIDQRKPRSPVACTLSFSVNVAKSFIWLWMLARLSGEQLYFPSVLSKLRKCLHNSISAQLKAWTFNYFFYNIANTNLCTKDEFYYTVVSSSPDNRVPPVNYE